jgi:hypothetical protein
VLDAGNSNGDIPVLEFTRHRDKPFLPLLLLHDDADREFAYTDGAEQHRRCGAGKKHRGPRPATCNRVLSAC